MYSETYHYIVNVQLMIKRTCFNDGSNNAISYHDVVTHRHFLNTNDFSEVFVPNIVLTRCKKMHQPFMEDGFAKMILI